MISSNWIFYIPSLANSRFLIDIHTNKIYFEEAPQGVEEAENLFEDHLTNLGASME